ncbi:putative baseplate tail tube cap [Synechococcus phage S-B05]|nr:putative baseplate tail tube cap [Synechococcus phage S-B05]
MSDVVKSSAIWNGLKVDSYTNVRTGEISLYQPKRLPAVLLARSIPANGAAKWSYEGNGANFRNIYNDQQRAIGGKELTQQEFNQQFFTKGTTAFNNIRGTILRTESNYVNAGIPITERELIKQGHFDNRVPGSVDPASDIMVNSDGTLPDRRTSGENLIQRDPIVPTSTGPGPGGGGGANDVQVTSFDDVSDAFNEDSRRNPRGRTTELLRYPLIEPPPEFKYDYISITAYDYIPDEGLKSGEKRFDTLKNPAETVYLPMQPQISETNAVSWSDDQLNPIQKMLGEAAMGAIKSLGDLDLQGLGSAFSNLGKNAGEIFKDPLTKKFATAYFAGQAVGANLVGRTTGMVINPNLELLFNGPNLRTFSFNFKLTPRYREESEQIRKIIRAFKRNMAVQKQSSGLFLKSPRIFQLKYIYKNGGEHPYLNKFKPCALSNFQVNYTPDGSYATFDETGSLTAYEITMDFTEVIPIYDTDIPTSETESMGY